MRIGLWDQYGGSMTSGWLRWIFEQFEFPFEVVYPADARSRRSGQPIRRAGVPERSDAPPGRPVTRRLQSVSPNADDIPEEYRKMLGRVTTENTIPQLRKFVEAGGTIVTIGDSTAVAQLFGLPVADAPGRKNADGKEHPLPREKFYVPGSVLAGERGQHQSRRLRHAIRRGCILRKQPRLSLGAGCGD